MRIGSWVMVALLAVATSQAQAQEELPINVAKTIDRAVFGKQTGHDKCVGGGHRNSGGGGHEDGECEEPAPSGPVSGAICTATGDVESAWSRYSCAVSANLETYSGEAVRYVEETATSVISYGDGAYDLVGTPPIPQPQVLPDPEAAVAYSGEAIRYVEATSNAILGFGDGAYDLVGTPPVPQPQVLPYPEANAYIGEVTFYAERTVTSVLGFGDGAYDLVGTPPIPQPQVFPDPESAIAYTTGYVDQTRFYAEQSVANVMNYADGAYDLVGTPPVPQPQVIPDPSRLLQPGG